MKKVLSLISTALLIFLPFFINAQDLTQTIRGKVIDATTQEPLIGATVQIVGNSQGSISDIDGTYIIEKVPVGRITLECSYIGYETSRSASFDLNSAKEHTENFELNQGLTLGEIVVKPKAKAPINSMAILSARSFTNEETTRYATSVGDPGRMAQSFPGVQPSKDNEGDIVIRGNSSNGLLWRLEGVDILNPNHFARIGGSGGGITIFSTSVLGASDFYTGAFPAEYGNALSGVFDMKFREGNQQKREHTARIGMLGLDYASEGPIKKGKSSYLFNYRYSTLGLLNQMGLHLVGERVNNNFQDLSFNLYFPGKDNRSSIKIWGLGGLSKETGTPKAMEDWQVFSDSLSRDARSDLGVLGLTYQTRIKDKNFLKTTLAVMSQRVTLEKNSWDSALSPTNIDDESYLTTRISGAFVLTRKVLDQHSMKLGIQSSITFSDLNWDSLRINTDEKYTYLNSSAQTLLFQPYLQFNLRFGNQWMINPGLNFSLYDISSISPANPNVNGNLRNSSVEPRLGIQFQAAANQSLSFAYGLHSQAVPLGTELVNLPEVSEIGKVNNLGLSAMKAHHFGLAYDWLGGAQASWRFHVELYWQRLLDIPVARTGAQTHWLLNEIEGYSTEWLSSSGKGTNKGIELLFEKSFSSGFFCLLTTSIFDSTFEPFNGETYDAQFNAKFTGALTTGKEWKVKGKNTLQVGFKSIYANGGPSTPIDRNASTPRTLVYDESRPFSERAPNYFRTDIRIAYRINKPKSAYSIAIDVQNAFNTKNKRAFDWTYDVEKGDWERKNQASLIPILTFQVDF